METNYKYSTNPWQPSILI